MIVVATRQGWDSRANVMRETDEAFEVPDWMSIEASTWLVPYSRAVHRVKGSKVFSRSIDLKTVF